MSTDTLNAYLVVGVLVFSLLRMCQTHKHIQSHIKHLNEIKDVIKNIEYRTVIVTRKYNKT